jgi:3-deoxy-7-phosphoheptulonate synthase
MAGPCSVESEKQIMETAEAVAAAGAKILRGGAFKPRTSPYDFQGMEGEGLKLLAKAREATGLAIITEVMSDRDVELVAEYADIMQVGARNMQNFALLKVAGPLRPSRHAQARPQFHHQGTAHVRRIHRRARQSPGHALRARHPHVRNRHAQHLRYHGGPVLNELTHLPVILDPSHATGKRSLVPALAAPPWRSGPTA